jgi:hypothetical protein
VHAIILERGRGSGIYSFDEMQNGAIWVHFRVSYNIESSTILMTLIDKNFLKLYMYQSALNLGKSFDISDRMTRRGGRKTTRANDPAETPKQYWRISMYYSYLDNLITNLKHISLNRKTTSMHSIYCPVL